MTKKDRIKRDRFNKGEDKFHDKLAKSKNTKTKMRRAEGIVDGSNYKRFEKTDLFR